MSESLYLSKEIIFSTKQSCRSSSVGGGCVAAAYKYVRITNEECAKPFKFDLFKCFLCSLPLDGLFLSFYLLFAFRFVVDEGNAIATTAAALYCACVRCARVKLNFNKL